MKLKSIIRMNYLSNLILFKLNHIDEIEWNTFLTIAEYVKNNKHVAALSEEGVISIKTYLPKYSDGVFIVLHHTDLKKRVMITVENYNTHDFYNIKLKKAIHKTIGASLKKNAWGTCGIRQFNYSY